MNNTTRTEITYTLTITESERKRLLAGLAAESVRAAEDVRRASASGWGNDPDDIAYLEEVADRAHDLYRRVANLPYA